jgi:hypothetical protein
MDLQNIITALIIVAAFLYAGNLVRHKIKAFRPKNDSCGADCGCAAKEKNKAAKI